MQKPAFVCLLWTPSTAGVFAAQGRDAGVNTTYDPATNTYTVTEPPDERSTAPDVPMEYGEAFRHWDGTGEVLLAPNRDARPDADFGIGATFDNSDATADDRSFDGVDLRCPALEAAYRIRNGMIVVSQGSPLRRRETARIDIRPHQPGMLFSNDRCRDRLVMATKVRSDDGWIDAPEVPPSAPPAPPAGMGRPIQMKKGETFVFNVSPAPQELAPFRMTSSSGARLPEGVADGCPKPSGSIDFEPRGVFLNQTWPSQAAYVPGIRRDVEARATTLIFQNAACREEIRVTREVKADGLWHASPLSPAPTTGEPSVPK